MALAWLLHYDKEGETLPRWPFESFWEGVSNELPHDRWSAVNAAELRVLHLLPDVNGEPVLTRDLVASLELLDVEIRGENKVNALSVLLARSSKIKGHGRAGWTQACNAPANGNEALSEAPASEETGAPNGTAAGASVNRG